MAQRLLTKNEDDMEKTTKIITLDSPIFILGLHRSGTTLLYRLLAESGCWNSLNAWHVIRYDEIKIGKVSHATSRESLRNQFAALGLQTREVDSVEIDPETKEEYGFILDNHGQGLQITRNNFPFFREICDTIKSTYDRQSPLLLKNPWDFGNATTIKALIPSARFVFIHRNPVHVVSSMWRFVRLEILQPMPYLSLLSNRYKRLTRSHLRFPLARFAVHKCPSWLVRLLIIWVSRQTKAYLTSCASIPREDRVEIRYEDLCLDPQRIMNRILKDLEVSGREVDYASIVGGQASRTEIIVSRQEQFLRRKLAVYYKRFGWN
jgi:hypothetical protein